MKTYEALYDNGKIFFKEKPTIKRANILVTFLEEIEDHKKITFPTRKLGKMRDIDRKKLYEEYHLVDTNIIVYE